MAAARVLGIAVSSGRAGYVFMQGSDILDWGITVKATRKTNDFVGFSQELITTLQPDVVVTEETMPDSRKGKRSRALIRAVADVASHNPVLDVSVPRSRRYPSKYDEAIAMVNRYPALAGYRPKRRPRVFDFEHRSNSLFEAVALCEAVMFKRRRG